MAGSTENRPRTMVKAEMILTRTEGAVIERGLGDWEKGRVQFPKIELTLGYTPEVLNVNSPGWNEAEPGGGNAGSSLSASEW